MSVAGPALTLRGHVHQGDDLLGVGEVDVEKTANSILNRRELHLSKEALLERTAYHLTKRFLKMGNDREQEKLARQAEQSRRLYEQTAQKAQGAEEAKVLMEQIVREQRSQIQDSMRDQGRQRQEEERQAKEERAEREKWRKARTIYEQMELERRTREREAQEKERVDKIKERMKSHEEAVKQVEDERTAQLKLRVEKEEKKAEEALKRRREKALQARSQGTKMAERAEQALQRKKELAEETAKSARETSRRRERKVAELKQQAELEFEEKQRRMMEKMLEERHQSESSQQRRSKERPEAQENANRQLGSGAVEELESPKVEEEEQKGEMQPSIYYYCTPRVGRELVLANAKVQKEYVRRCDEMESQKQDMLTRKRFKGLADAAKTIGDKYEGSCTRRMRSLHKMYIDPKPREASTSSGATTSASTRASPRRTPRGGVGGSAVGQLKPCALCDRHLPPASLEGWAMQKTVDKLREQGPAVPWARDGPAAEPPKKAVSNSPTGEPGSSQVSKAERAGERLYDHEVRLCTACWHHLRHLRVSGAQPNTGPPA